MRFQFGNAVRTNRWVRRDNKDSAVEVIAEVLDVAAINSQSETTSHDNDLYLIRYPDKHETTRYRSELRPCD